MTTAQDGREDQQDAIRIAPLDDASIVEATLKHPRIYPHITDDGSLPADQFRAEIGGPMLYLGAFNGSEYLGLFAAHPHNCVTYEVHTCLLPSAWGAMAIRAAKAVVAWLFSSTPCRRVITSVPAGNALALRLAKLAGLSVFGVNEKSFLRGGVLVDQTLLGISFEGAPCR